MRALLSVSNKNGLVELARALHQRGCELVSTGGTARALGDAAVPVVPVAEVTRFPEMLDGRVKTLHPAIHGGILFRRHRSDDREAIARHGITPIDLVVVNLYPFVSAAVRPDIDVDALIEEIDIGGPSLVRAAAKNFLDVLVVVSPDDYAAVIAQLDEAGGPSREFRLGLARKAFAHTAAYDAAIADELSRVESSGDAFVRRPRSGSSPDRLELRLEKARDLRYGENPHQQASWFVPVGTPNVSDAILQGKELSYNNLLDLDAAIRLVAEFDEPAAAIVKHTNPCGVAIADDIRTAYVRAREADALSAFGGIVAVNRGIDEPLARELVSTFLEAVAGPSVDEAARAILGSKANLRLVLSSAPVFRLVFGAPRREYRSVLGGLLGQDSDEVVEARAPWSLDEARGRPRVVTRRAPGEEEWEALRFAWRVCAHVKSNAVIFTSRDRTLAIGAGQMSRVDAVNVAVMRAAGRGAGPSTWLGAGRQGEHGGLAGSVAASDAFFPFPDGVVALARAGATAVVQPGGSVRDAEVIAAADEHGLAMVFTGRRHFRH
jgi:phosphoribosylaminoimidazolecarboxamide formyltransferase/IMP cyclohydrolase